MNVELSERASGGAALFIGLATGIAIHFEMTSLPVGELFPVLVAALSATFDVNARKFRITRRKRTSEAYRSEFLSMRETRLVRCAP
jgi:hypothetical protein